MATLNNESEELNVYRIERFGLREHFPDVSSRRAGCGVRKPTHEIYERVLGMTQADPARTLFVDDRLQNLAPAAALGMQDNPVSSRPSAVAAVTFGVTRTLLP